MTEIVRLLDPGSLSFTTVIGVTIFYDHFDSWHAILSQTLCGHNFSYIIPFLLKLARVDSPDNVLSI